MLNPIPLFKRLTPLLAFLLFSPAYGYVEDRELEYILNQQVEAMGGRGAIQEISTISMRGTTTGESGNERRLLLVRKLPNKIRLNLTSDDVKLVVGYDGSEVWYYYDQQGKIITPEKKIKEFESIRRDAAFWLPIVQFEKADYKISRLPDETIEDKKYYVFQADIDGLGTERYYLDQSTFLPMRREIDEINEEGETETTLTTYGDYQVTDGVQFPMWMQTVGKDGTSVKIEFDRISINKGIFDSYFKKPRGIFKN